MDGLTPGRIVHYVLSETDVESIDEKRKQANNIPLPQRVPGVEYTEGNHVEAGQHCAMVIVQVWNTEGMVNGKVLLDGKDTLWVTSRKYSDAKEPHSWHWIEKA